jgi:membrane-associated HD superfamily phosphohydrolase
MIGGFIGGAFVESLGFLGIFESVVALIIYLINWTLIPKKAAENANKRNLATYLGVLTVSLLAGTSYILYQYTILPQLFPLDVAFTILIPTFLLNLPIAMIACPALIRTISPKLRTWGMYTGNFAEWRSKKAQA